MQSATLNSNTTNYTYDANGNTVKKVTTTVDGTSTTDYVYDNKNQLVGVRSSVNGQPSATIEYVYDGNGNRYSKTITLSGGTANTRYYSYDTGGNIVSEYKRVILNGSEESQTLVRYVRDTSGKAISMIQGANTYYFTYNGHGDVTALTDSTGTVVATYSYDEFGNQTSSTGTVYNPLRYSGAHNTYYDEETASASSAQDGLYKMGTRYYQPDIARWLTRDSYGGSQENLQSRNRYIYTENNPISNTDPTGNHAEPLYSDNKKVFTKKKDRISKISAVVYHLIGKHGEFRVGGKRLSTGLVFAMIVRESGHDLTNDHAGPNDDGLMQVTSAAGINRHLPYRNTANSIYWNIFDGLTTLKNKYDGWGRGSQIRAAYYYNGGGDPGYLGNLADKISYVRSYKLSKNGHDYPKLYKALKNAQDVVNARGSY